jgi:hypothetical protein
MTDMTITNQTNNDYTFGPYHLPAGAGTSQVTIDTTTNASLYLTDDAFADIINALYGANPQAITVSNPPTPFPRVTGVPQLLHGDGTPEAVVFAPSGSLFMRRDNLLGFLLYGKSTGPSLSTGWKPFAALTAPEPGTTLPSSPSDGQQAILVDSTSAPTYVWVFQYSATASKWLFIGGTPALTNTSGTVAYTGSWQEAAYFAVPRAGTYYVQINSGNTDASSNVGNQAGVSKAGATPSKIITWLSEFIPSTGDIVSGFAATNHASIMVNHGNTSVHFSNVAGLVIPVWVT